MKRILLLSVLTLFGWTLQAQTYTSCRPAPRDRLFVSDAVEKTIAEVQSLLDQRAAARQAKNWAESDRLRDAIAALGWTVKDTKDGPRVSKS